MSVRNLSPPRQPRSRLVNEAWTASYLHIDEEQLAAWPEENFGPPRILLPDGSARFKVQSIDDWVEAEERRAATS